jgi:hypothetical protein
MAVVQIQMNKPEQVKSLALFNLGFRPFFSGGSCICSAVDYKLDGSLYLIQHY